MVDTGSGMDYMRPGMVHLGSRIIQYMELGMLYAWLGMVYTKSGMVYMWSGMGHTESKSLINSKETQLGLSCAKLSYLSLN